jgi:hypothetical protein
MSERYIDIDKPLSVISAAVAKAIAAPIAEQRRQEKLARQVHEEDQASGKIGQSQADGYIEHRINPALMAARNGEREMRLRAWRDCSPLIAQVRGELEAQRDARRAALLETERQLQAFIDGLTRLEIPARPYEAPKPARAENPNYEPTLSGVVS